MTDEANITGTNITSPRASSQNFRYGSHFESAGWVAPTTLSLIGGEGDLSSGAYNAFDHTATSGLDVTIDTGEAVVAGSIIARDTQTTVSLPASTNGIDVLAGYHPNSVDSLQIDVSGNFASGAHTIPLWTFDTNSTDVTASSNERLLGPEIEVKNSRYETDDGSGTTVDKASSATTAANADTLGGSPPGEYAKLSEDESVTGAWSIQNASNVVTESFLLDRSGYGFSSGVGGASNERPFIAPYQNGGTNFSDEITYDTDHWRIETPLEIVSEGQWAVFSGTQYEIQKDGTDGAGIINFKTT